MYNDEIWWTRVPTAMKRINDAKTALKNWQSVAIEGDAFPWRESFTRIVIDQLNSEEPNIYYCTLDLSNLQDSSAIIDEIAEQLSIGYNKKRTIMNLRPELPEAGIIWELLNVNNEHLSDIEKLIIQISECDAHIAFLFAKPQRLKIKRCCEIGFYPVKIDLQYYAWTLLMGKLPDHMLEYASFFAVELSGGQPERCASLCGDIHNCLTNPDIYCNWLTGSQLVSGIHVAQVRGIQPYIEYGRFRLIETLGTRMNAILPFTDEYNVYFSKPIEVELRNIVFYRVELQLTDNENEILSILYNARNKISHLEILTLHEIEVLLKCEYVALRWTVASHRLDSRDG